MADIEMVIKIPEYDYNNIKEYYETHETVEATYSYIYHGTPLPKGQGRLIERVLNAAETLKQKTGHWISVSERLPKPYEQVLRTVKSIGWNDTFHIHVDIGTICPIDTDVIAWMPLPEPYEPQESEERNENTSM